MVFLIVLARANLQSITIDEATTYELYVAAAGPAYWDGASNNHILNSIIMTFFTSIFGLSHLTMRSGALIGAGIYITGAHQFCRLAASGPILQWVIFLSLVANPFVLDYLVAARGYSLATGLLLWTLLIPARRMPGLPAWRQCIACSTVGALCIAANFSFGIVACAAVLMGTLWVMRREPRGQYLQIAAASTGAGLLVLGLFAAHAILNWPAGQLWWGATSLLRTFQTVAESSLHEPNRYLLDPLLLKVFRILKPMLIPLLAVMCAGKLLLLWRERAWNRDEGWRWHMEFAGVIACTLALTILIHWLGFRFFHMLLPQERTALYIPVLLTTIIGLAAGLPVHGRFGGAVNGALLASLLVVTIYFASCLRLTYFKEWEWNRDVQQAYGVIARYTARDRAYKVASSWHYATALNFYRRMSPDPAVPEVVSGDPIPNDAEIYALHYAFHLDFINQQHLAIVYQGESSMVVAVRPGVERR